MCKYNIVKQLFFIITYATVRYETVTWNANGDNTYREMYFFPTSLRHSVDC